ncbi:MAG: AbrB/MazE/SpoVT family DNA-binding domain-containing protein [Pseudomonadota bacterium]
MNKPSTPPAGHALKLVKIGNSTGVILPKEWLEKRGLKQGDELSLSEDEDGFTLKPSDSDFAEQMKAAREVMMRRKRALRELAK